MLPRFLSIINHHSDGINVSYTYNELVHKYLLRVAMDNCIGIIALSRCALSIQERILSAYPDLKERILSKTTMIHPPQKPLTNAVKIKNKDLTIINFLFVGSDFYRKGGAESVLAFDRITLIDEFKGKARLTIIGDLQRRHNYAHKEFHDGDDFFSSIESCINKNKMITHYTKIDNESLISSLDNCHIGLLPSWADTFGYSVLEFQAAGCPVISTDVRALTEINNNDVGWIVPVRKNDLNEVILNSLNDKNKCRSDIVNGVFKVMLEIMINPEVIYKKGVLSLDRIQREHSIDSFNEDISIIYER